MLLLSFVLCITHPVVSCQAARATGLLPPYAIINSLASCINWPLVPAQNRGSPIPAASSEAAQKPQPVTAKNCPPNESEKLPNGAGKTRNWQHWSQGSHSFPYKKIPELL